MFAKFDPETAPANASYHGPPQVILAYLKYQWSVGDDNKRKEAFFRLKVWYKPSSCDLIKD